ncbi:MAG: alpha/beta hydrolase [Anaerolineales bacterium]|nr:alpha/beta hydrolase [Anaerolineales bacterium]
MSTITTNQGILHYEVFGRGRPVILLHGWLGSWGLWQDTMEYLGQSYRTYALDFWGFGESDFKQESFMVDDFVSMVDQFMETLGIARAPLVGHSMGGTVSLSMAIRYPQRVSQVTVIGSPINGASLAPLLKLAGVGPVAYVVHNFMGALKLGLKVYSPLVTRDRSWAEMISRDLSKTSLQSFLQSIASLRKTDLSSELPNVDAPILGMYGKHDVIVHPQEWRRLEKYARYPKILKLEKSGHFPMLDQPNLFMRTVKNFLDGNPVEVEFTQDVRQDPIYVVR